MARGWRKTRSWGDLRRRRADETGERAESQSQQRQWQLLNQQPDGLWNLTGRARRRSRRH